MSATNRGAERQKDDFYETPGWTVRRYLDLRSMTMPVGRWLEPSAGQGAIIRAVDNWLIGNGCDAQPWMAIDLNHSDRLLNTGARCYFGNFLDEKVSASTKFEMCIGNPPYSLAVEFIEKALTLSHEVAFLLRLNFLESAKRAAFFRNNQCDIRVLPNRPSFRADGHTDATAYAWFEFGRGHGGKMTVLGATSKAERLADRVQS